MLLPPDPLLLGALLLLALALALPGGPWLRGAIAVACGAVALVAARSPAAAPEAAAMFGAMALISMAHLGLALRGRAPVHMDDRDNALYELTFRDVRPRDFARLMALATRVVAVPGDTLIRPGDIPDRLLLLEAGRAGVHIGRGALIQLRPGQFVGEMSFLTDRIPLARVVAMEPARLVAWEVQPLRDLLREAPALEAAFHKVLGADLVEKLRAEGALSLPSRPMGRPAADAPDDEDGSAPTVVL